MVIFERSSRFVPLPLSYVGSVAGRARRWHRAPPGVGSRWARHSEASRRRRGQIVSFPETPGGQSDVGAEFQSIKIFIKIQADSLVNRAGLKESVVSVVQILCHGSLSLSLCPSSSRPGRPPKRCSGAGIQESPRLLHPGLPGLLSPNLLSHTGNFLFHVLFPFVC